MEMAFSDGLLPPNTAYPAPLTESRLKTTADTLQEAFAVYQARLNFVCRFQRDLL